eukprot:7913262-Alexandrium_andersonii.AAC.1
MSAMSASSTPALPSGSMGWHPSTATSNTATPRPCRPLARRGTGRPSLVCWAAIPRRIAAQSAG